MKSDYMERNRFVVAQERQHAMAVASHGGALGHLTVEAAHFASRSAHRVADWLQAHHVINNAGVVGVEADTASEEPEPLMATVTHIGAARSYQGLTAPAAGIEAAVMERGE